MLFSSISFLYYFLPVVLIAYFLVPISMKNIILLFSSLFFYGWGESKYVFLMIIIIVIGYIMGLLIEKYRETGIGVLCLFISVTVDIFVLGYFAIWAVIYGVTKKRTRKLNEILDKNRMES